jgi:Fe-S oxidoreductase
LCRVSWLVNPLLNTVSVRWAMEKLFGVSRFRKLPPLAHQTFLKSARREWLSPPVSLRDPVPVIYFVDHFANTHDPELAFAFAQILEHHGKTLHVPPAQLRSGMAMISMGDLDAARPLAMHNVRVLAEFAREGCPIVCTEPSAAVCLKFEYPRLLDHPDVQLVADHVIEAGNYLAGLYTRGELRTDFAPLPMTGAYHTPCHLRSLGRETPLVDLCRLIPEFQASSVDHGCSGLAGTFGLTREHFEESLVIGQKLMEQMRSDQVEFGLTECSSCKLQMEQQSTTPTLHPLKVLALAYGLLPEIRRRLKPNLRKRLTS